MALKKVGALWQKNSKQNKSYLSGTLDLGVAGEARIMIFENEKKEEKHPDYYISLATDDPAKDKKA